ncbi:exodeoxyribonuclease V subunit gamma [Spirochaeta isovalerica]|uniref:Exodeoxyribonuclease V gamma subunit n=1 Tax=Spirochaeta isovalerica TaxID=150 RepID=A0A841RFQ3_9SPIO|nr:exodeoxyribonuclease V subunit gamma [Spirochaeta isovalerica]MBB6482047.1 exodeoxyribonuclease V gamma subunit [Spirochaeta isovalerica]
MPEYRLFLSNELRSFIRQYGEVLRGRALFGEKVFLIVQNRSMGEWLKLELAGRYGVSANLNIVLPENAVRTFIRSFPLGREMLEGTGGREEKAVLFMDNLKVIVYKKLEELLRTDLPGSGSGSGLFRELENYIKGTGSGEKDFQTINSLRLYQLSDSIAGLFYYYGMNCQALISSWEKGIPFLSVDQDPVLLKHERWQMAIWNELFSGSKPYIHLSSILSAIAEERDEFDGDPVRVILFGSTFMGDSSLRFFRHLSQFVPVDHFALSPTLSSEPFSMPLLKSWGALYEGFRNLMDELSSGTEQKIHREFPLPEKNTLLSHIQGDFLLNKSPDLRRPVHPDDRSLTVVSTTGRWREVEALKNRILSCLESDPELKLTDIGVLAPDINEYAQYIEAVFPSEDSAALPFNIIDLKGEGDSPFISGFMSLLNLTGARFTRKELFSLFSNRCFAASQRIDSAEYDNWLSFCDQLNIKWAVDSGHKRELGIHGTDFNSWERGFERILEGLALSEAEKPFDAPFSLMNESDAYSAGRLIHIIRSLHRDLNLLADIKLRLEEWVLVWERIMETYLAAAEDDPGRDDSDRLRLKGCFRDILNMVNELDNLEELSNRNFDFYMFKSLLTEFINKSGGSRGRYLTQGISCASLKPLRAVPFKVIMVLGLNEEAFPASDDALSFDLKDTDEVQSVISIDLSRRTSDKYSFLEVFLSAEDKVTLFYTGRNNVDNEILQPSSLISELAGYIDDHFYIDGKDSCFSALVEWEKLQPFDREYFSGHQELVSYSRRDFKLSEIYYGIRKIADPVRMIDSLPLNQEETVLELTFSDLLMFLKNPLKVFYNKSCGVYIGENELPEEDAEENVEADFFINRSFLEELLHSGISDEGDGESIDDKLEEFSRIQNARGEQIDNELSVPFVDRLKENTVNLLEQIHSIPYLLNKPEPVAFTFGDETKLEEGILRSPAIRLENNIEVRIKGTLPPLYVFENQTFVYAGLFNSDKARLSHFFVPYLISGLLPEDVMNSHDLKAYLLSPKGRESAVFNQKEGFPDMAGLIGIYLDNQQSPLPLYPEIGEEAVKRWDQIANSGSVSFTSAIREIWNDKISAMDRGFSLLKTCPYRTAAYPDLPDFDGDRMSRFVDLVYCFLNNTLKKGKGK